MASSSKHRNKSLIALGRALCEIRKEKAFSQKELADCVNLHESYISVIEHSRRNPTWGVVIDIIRALDCPLEELASRIEKFEPS